VGLALLVLHFLDGAGDGSAINVYVEDAQEDADSLYSGALRFDGDYFTVSGGDHDGTGGDGAFRVAEEVKTE
jgi:hypothetical protein